MLQQLQRERVLVIALLGVAILASPVAADGPKGDDLLPTEAAPFDPREAVAKVVAYQTSHPEFAAAIATWVSAGLVLLITAVVVFLYSEIQAMLGMLMLPNSLHAGCCDECRDAGQVSR
jgi:hypothetical protein